jgi:hypothetical protein
VGVVAAEGAEVREVRDGVEEMKHLVKEEVESICIGKKWRGEKGGAWPNNVSLFAGVKVLVSIAANT